MANKRYPEPQKDLIEGEELSRQSYEACEESLPMEGMLFEDGVLDLTYDARLDVRSCHFERCRFPINLGQRVDFKDCSFNGCDFSGAQMVNCAFRSCKVQDVQVSDCKMDHFVSGDLRWSKLKLENCSLRQSEMRSTSLRDLDLRSCDIAGLSIDPSALRGCIVTPEQAMMLAALLGLRIQPL